MHFVKYSSSLVAGAAGVLTGFLYHNVSSNRSFLIAAATPVKLEIDAAFSKDIENYVTRLTPVMKHGFPSYNELRVRKGFVLSYDTKHRNPHWVMEHLTADTVNEESGGDRKRSRFLEDKSIHSYFRATLDDYRDGDYDRGHLAAAANHKYCQPALDDTFILSNIAPQNVYFNQVIWKALEKRVRELANKCGSVYVCSGPLYLPREIHAEEEDILKFLQEKPNKRKRKIKDADETPKVKKYVIYEVIGENNVAVPTHFFKIIVIEAENDQYDMEAYIVPNQRLDFKKPLSTYMVPRDAVERAAGFLLFHQLPSSKFRYINGEEGSKSS